MAIVTKTLEQEYIEAAEQVDPSTRTRNILEAKLVIAEDLVPTTTRRRHTEDSADRVILDAAVNPAPLPATDTVVSNAQTVTLLPATGTTPAQGTGTAAVATSTLTGVRLAATRVALSTGATAPVQNSAGAAIGTGTITIAANAVSHVRLPATVAGVSNGAALTVPVTGSYTTTATVAVANGVITGITLS